MNDFIEIRIPSWSEVRAFLARWLHGHHCTGHDFAEDLEDRWSRPNRCC